ncbi:hypothetical protein SAMN04490191_5809 [Pseudomonas lini]|uniref:Uncharacterized protein n=1 Tax=Pseudomonas lini TaxID=163011 RepID=A0A1H2C1U7_9PSED|nr:hypothetical protein SAMN04490191_5809 [Pseudomonas lini]
MTVVIVAAGMAVTGAAGTAGTEAAGTMTIEATIGRIIGAVGAITVMAIGMADATTGKPLNKKRRMKRRFFCA